MNLKADMAEQEARLRELREVSTRHRKNADRLIADTRRLVDSSCEQIARSRATLDRLRTKGD